MKSLRLAQKAVRRAWMKYALRGVGGNDNHARLDLAYRIPDPWNMDSKLEQFRFERTNRIITQQFAGIRSILEVGCGEGHQTAWLRRLCDRVYGIDVSPTAVERARKRVPDAEFADCDIFATPWREKGESFDLVVACEVLYYVSDIPATIAEMNRIGNNCLVTMYAPAIRRVGPWVEAIPNVGKDWFGTHGAEWVVAYWRNPWSRP